MYQFDVLRLQKNCPVMLNNMEFVQPTLGELVDIGYDQYQNHLYTLISTSLDIADILWCKAKIFYEDIKDEWKFFIEQALSSADVVKIWVNGKVIEGIAINTDYSDALNFFLKTKGRYIVLDKRIDAENMETYLCNVTLKEKVSDTEIYELHSNNFKFTKSFYTIFTDYLRAVNWFIPQYKFLSGGTKYAKKIILEQKYKKRQRDRKKKNKDVDLSSIVSSLIAKGQPYPQIYNYPIYLIYDLYYRLMRIDNWENTMLALYNGCIDTKKHPVNFEKINWAAVINNKEE